MQIDLCYIFRDQDRRKVVIYSKGNSAVRSSRAVKNIKTDVR